MDVWNEFLRFRHTGCWKVIVCLLHTGNVEVSQLTIASSAQWETTRHFYHHGWKPQENEKFSLQILPSIMMQQYDRRLSCYLQSTRLQMLKTLQRSSNIIEVSTLWKTCMWIHIVKRVTRRWLSEFFYNMIDVAALAYIWHDNTNIRGAYVFTY